MKNAILAIATALAVSACATGKPHTATQQMERITGKTITTWAITPRGNDAQLDIYVDGGATPAATLFLVP